MAAGRLLGCVCAAFVLLGATAQAGEVLTLRAGGGTVQREDPGVASRDATHLRERGRRTSTRSFLSRARAKVPKRTVTRELRAMLDAGTLDPTTYALRRAEYVDFKTAVKHFSGRRRSDMAGVLAVVDGIAGRGQLTPSRLPALWLTMQRNREWWNEGPLLGSGARVSFEGSELVWQYVPGEGLQIHPLANFGKLNALWRSRSGATRMQLLADELLALPAERAGGIAWEYYFDFDGGRPPWVSGLAQGTALQALSRAAIRMGRLPELLPRLQQGLGIFRTAPPEGVRTAADGGIHYVQYSFAPGLRILNGFVQSLVGLYDFAAATGDASARQLFADGEVAARAEVPTYDTGAWSLYSRGTATRESDLNYHGVLRDFLQSLCERTAQSVYCDAVTHFDAYLLQPPVVSMVTRRLRGGRTADLRFRLSKISRVTVQLLRGSRTVMSRSAVLGRGVRGQRLDVPRKPGSYAVSIVATDLAGNAASITGTVEVLKPRKARKRH
jgi:D-glucuronyl C5-epimerase C-terminus